MKLSAISILFTSLVVPALAAPARRWVDRTIQLDQGQFVGATDGVVNRFLGIPFALPP